MVLGVLDQFIIGLGGDLGFICNFLKTNFGTPNRLINISGDLFCLFNFERMYMLRNVMDPI